MELKSLFFKSLMFFAAILVFPQIALGIGQTTDPIIINDALRGQTFQKEMIVLNTDKESTLVGIKAEGDIAAWTKFYKTNNLKNPIDAVLLKAGERVNLFAQIAIPKDIRNGKYSGFLSVTKTPKSEVASAGSSSSVLQKIDRKVDITVKDTQNIELNVSVIPEKYDLEEKEPLKVRFIYDNQGNVAVEPEINLKIKEDDKVLFNINYPFSEGVEAIKPKAVFEIPPIEVPTSMLEKGRYAAEFDFVVDGKSVANNRFMFSVGQVAPQSAAITQNAPDAKSKVSMTTVGSYKNWIISGLFGIFAIAFMIYSFAKPKKKKKVYIKKIK